MCDVKVEIFYFDKNYSFNILCVLLLIFLHPHLKITAGLDKLATPYTQYPLRARPQEEADWYNSTHIRA